MDGDKGEIDATNLQTLQQLTAEVQSGSRSSDSSFVLGIDGLEILCILRCDVTLVDDVAWQGRRTQCKQLALELVVGTVVKEAQRTSATGGIVNDLGHHRSVFFKEEFVANTNLACRLYQHIPQAKFFIQLTQQEHLNLGIGLLLGTKQTGRKHLGVVEHHDIAIIEVVDDVAEEQELVCVVALSVLGIHIYCLTLAVNDHHTAFVTSVDLVHGAVFVLKNLVRRFQCQAFSRHLKSEL